jgi:HEPN domain-containing protein
MTSDRMARDYLQRARARRIAVDALFTARGYADVVRESQDVVELVLKGALRFVGVEPPKRHDVHVTVEEFIERFPPEWRRTVAELREALDRLAADRAPAFYGDEAEGVPASELFGEDDGRRAMTVADRLLELYARLLSENR